MRDGWLKAEKLAELDHVKGVGWHSLRRRFAGEPKDVPREDLAGLGGWRDEGTVLECYRGPISRPGGKRRNAGWNGPAISRA